MIISQTKVISIKHFCIQKTIEVETRWQLNKSSNTFFYSFTFSMHIQSDSTYFFEYK